MKPLLIVPIGLPASGKSWLGEWLTANGLIGAGAVVSSDALRVQLRDTRADMTANRHVFDLAEQITRIRLAEHLDVYQDATNLTDGSRELAATIAHDYGAKIIWVRLPASDGLCLGRNRQRLDAAVPEDVMGRFRVLLADVNWDYLAMDGEVMDMVDFQEFMMNRKFVEKT